jgi:predicted dinucleotide-binding enzyme
VTRADLGIVGAGRLGSAIARLAVPAGLEVVLANSRGPETLAGLVGELGPTVRAATATEVAASADLVVLAVPLHTLPELPAAPLVGRTVIDTTNYYRDRNGPVAELDAGAAASSRLVQRRFVGASVVKALSTIDSVRLVRRARRAGDPERSALPVAGDDAGAVERVVDLLDRLGYDSVVVGGLDNSRCIEPGAPAYGAPYRGPQPADVDHGTWMAENPGVTVSATVLRALVVAGSPAPAERSGSPTQSSRNGVPDERVRHHTWGRHRRS